MNFTLSSKPDFADLQHLERTLSDADLSQIATMTIENVSKLNLAQFLFLSKLMTARAKNFKQFINCLSQKLNQLAEQELENKLQIENFLASHVLKRFESQEAYNLFYSSFDHHYSCVCDVIKTKKPEQNHGILFFVHNPVFLAHTNPLFRILADRKISIPITIASFGNNPDFEAKCSQIGVNFFQVQGDSISQKLENLHLFSMNFEQLVWQCLPTFLPYFSKISNNVTWWSFKFNPTITNVKKYITSLPTSDSFKMINQNKWLNFSPKFHLYNKHSKPVLWSARRGVIGSFCREELIDDERYWSLIAFLLKQNENLHFRYCGRASIHQKWIMKFDINPTQVSFLGWLEKPHEEILKVAVILDTFSIKHGLMGYEALTSGIPIIFPKNGEGFGGIVDVFKRVPSEQHIKDPKDLLGFSSFVEAKNIVEKLGFNERENEVLGQYTKQLMDSFPQQEFEEFYSLL